MRKNFEIKIGAIVTSEIPAYQIRCLDVLAEEDYALTDSQYEAKYSSVDYSDIKNIGEYGTSVLQCKATATKEVKDSLKLTLPNLFEIKCPNKIITNLNSIGGVTSTGDLVAVIETTLYEDMDDLVIDNVYYNTTTGVNNTSYSIDQVLKNTLDFSTIVVQQSQELLFEITGAMNSDFLTTLGFPLAECFNDYLTIPSNSNIYRSILIVQGKDSPFGIGISLSMSLKYLYSETVAANINKPLAKIAEIIAAKIDKDILPNLVALYYIDKRCSGKYLKIFKDFVTTKI